MKNAVFWDVTSCGLYKNLRFGGLYRHHHQGGKNRRAWESLGHYAMKKHKPWQDRNAFTARGEETLCGTI
jgi:hypothetical protein